MNRCNKHWCIKEIRILTENCNKLKNKDIAKLLNRSIHSISKKLSRLNIVRDEEFRLKIIKEIGFSNKGKPKSKTQKIKMSDSRKLFLKKNPNTLVGKNNPNYGNTMSKKNRKIISFTNKGRITKGFSGKKHKESSKIKTSKTLKSKYDCGEFDYVKRIQSETSKLNWKKDSYRNKVIKNSLKSLLKRPTSFEQKIILLCSKYKLPFIYTGDGRILIGYKNPDFLHKKNKIIIEVFLNYFKIRDYGSVENYIKEREKHFAKYGYTTIFIREEEIMNKNWEEICLNKVMGGI